LESYTVGVGTRFGGGWVIKPVDCGVSRTRQDRPHFVKEVRRKGDEQSGFRGNLDRWSPLWIQTQVAALEIGRGVPDAAVQEHDHRHEALRRRGPAGHLPAVAVRPVEAADWVAQEPGPFALAERSPHRSFNRRSSTLDPRLDEFEQRCIDLEASSPANGGTRRNLVADDL